MADSDDTILRLSGIGVVPYSAMGLKETLVPIQAATSLRRTVNGQLVDLSAAQFRKYAWAVSGADVQPPACDGVWPGRSIVVDCITELAYLTDSASPERVPVEYSQRVLGDFTIYRPRLTIVVTGLQLDTDEWGAVKQWTLSGEEE